MRTVRSDPIERLSLLPVNAGEKLERAWLQDAIAWLKGVPPSVRGERLRHLALAIRESDPALDLKGRFVRIWTEAFAPRLFVEAGLPVSASLVREMVRRIQWRILPQLESRLDLCAALRAAEVVEADAD